MSRGVRLGRAGSVLPERCTTAERCTTLDRCNCRNGAQRRTQPTTPRHRMPQAGVSPAPSAVVRGGTCRTLGAAPPPAPTRNSPPSPPQPAEPAQPANPPTRHNGGPSPRHPDTGCRRHGVSPPHPPLCTAERAGAGRSPTVGTDAGHPALPAPAGGTVQPANPPTHPTQRRIQPTTPRQRMPQARRVGRPIRRCAPGTGHHANPPRPPGRDLTRGGRSFRGRRVRWARAGARCAGRRRRSRRGGRGWRPLRPSRSAGGRS